MTTISSIDARYAQVQVGEASKKVAASVQNLVSGTKSNANVADLSVGTVLASRVNTLRVAVGNAGQGKSLLETAKGGLNTILGLLQQQKALATKSSDDTLGNNERGFLNLEFQSLVSEIDRIASTANFNGKALLDGSISGAATVATATGLSKENYGTIAASDLSLKGTVASGDLLTNESVRGTNRVTISANGTAGSATVFTIKSPIYPFSAANISFTSGSTINETINNLAAAVNEYSSSSTNATNAKAAIVQNFRIINNGDNSFTIEAKEAGKWLGNYSFLFSTYVGLVANVGVNGSLATVNGMEQTLDTNTSITGTDYAAGTDGTFGTIAANNVGQTAGIAELKFSATAASTVLTVTDWNGVTGHGFNASATVTFTASGDAEDDYADLIDIINGGNGLTASDGVIGGSVGVAAATDILRQFVFEKNGADSILIKGARKGTILDGFEFKLSSNVASGTLNGTSIDNLDVTFMAGTEIQTSADRALTTTDATINANLSGSLTNFKATFNQGSGTLSNANNGQAVTRNNLTFSVDVNGKTYVSDPVYLHGGSGLSTLGQWGDTISANQLIIFSDPNGPKDANGILTDNAFTLKMGSSARTLADTTTAAQAQNSANTIADAWEAQLAATTINSTRSLNLAEVNASNSDHRLTKAIGTVLEGLRGFDAVGSSSASYHSGDITLTTSDYSSTGTIGNIGKFDVNRLTNTIKTTVDGVEYTAYLSSADIPSIGNVVAYGTNLDGTSNIGSYNSTTKIIDLQDNTAANLVSSSTRSVLGTAKFHFFSSSTTDGRVLTVDLGNVSANTSQLNISTAEGEAGLEDALNAVFGVSSNESLNFQVGSAASDTIGISISGTKTTDVYLNSSGVATVLSVDTIANAKIASDVLDNAINNVVTRVASVSAKISSFNSSIQNNQASIQNADASRSILLDTDYTAESTMFAESRVRVDAATAVLAQINTRAANLLQLLRQ